MIPPRRDEEDSQAALAASIAREVQERLPGRERPETLTEPTEDALRAKAQDNELVLAYVRAGALVALTFLYLAALVRPAVLGPGGFPGMLVLGLAGAALAAVGLGVALHLGWYDPRLRRLIPAGDALIIGGGIVLLAGELGMGAGEPDMGAAAARTGLAALGASACAYLALSGAVRLSRSSQRLAAVLAVVDWIAITWILQIRALEAVFVGLILIGIGVFGNRLTGLIRQLIADEVERAQLDRMYREAEAAVKTREEVLSMVAHDLKNPLGTIVASGEMLQMEGIDPEARSTYIEAILSCGTHMDRLIRDLHDVARLEAGRMTIHPEPVRPDDLTERVLELMGPMARRLEVELDVRVPSDLPPVRVDEERVVRVFTNLIGNAVKFTSPGGRVIVRAQRVGPKVRFTVVDRGPGIEPGQASRLFEKFWQASADDRSGIGLGLAICRSIVEAHGERIGVDSPPGAGSEFWFTAAVADG